MGDSTSVAMTSISLTGRSDEASPPIIGIYGVPGAGKSFILERLEEELADHDQFAFFEGSEVISALVPGGLEAFKQLPESGKLFWRENAITRIQKHCVNSRRAGVVTGHFIFWDENDAQHDDGDDGETAPEPVMTAADRTIFTHILYLDVDPKLLAQRRNADTNQRQRASVSVHHFGRWVKHEKAELARICLDEGIVFWSSTCISASRLPTEMSVLVRDIAVRTEAYNIRMAKDLLDQCLGSRCDKLERILVFDGDKTLTEVDTGEMFSRVVSKRGEDALKPIFKKMGYSFSAFQQINLLHESFDPDRFDNCTTTVADAVMLHPEFKDLIGKALASEHVGVVLITCGSAAIWRKVCARFFPDSYKIPVIGCGRLGKDSVVVTPEVKAELCKYLQDIYRCEVYAFGDSPIDIEMLVQADKAFVAVCSEQARSESMEKKLEEKLWCSSLSKKPFRPKQVLLPPTVTPRLDNVALPQVDITSTAFLNTVLHKKAHSARPLVLHATFKGAAKLLMTPTRDPAVSWRFVFPRQSSRARVAPTRATGCSTRPSFPRTFSDRGPGMRIGQCHKVGVAGLKACPC